MDSTIFSTRVEDQAVAKEVPVLTWYEAFEMVTYGRKKRGVRYSMALIFTLLILGK